MITDKLGQEINLGDYVAYAQSGYVRIHHGVVTKFGNANNVKVNDCDWPSADACIVISKQVVDNQIAQDTISRHKEMITEVRPSGATKLKFGVVYSGVTDKLYVISFIGRETLDEAVGELSKRLGLTHRPHKFVARHKPRWYSQSSHFFNLHAYPSYTEKCLSRKALREIGMEEYIDNPDGMPYSESVFALDGKPDSLPQYRPK